MNNGKTIARRLLSALVPLVITVGLCWLLFTGVDVRSLAGLALAECDFSWIAGMVLLNVAAIVVRAMRWQLQLNALDVRSPLGELTLSIAGTYAVNLVFPRLGEVWRTGYIARRRRAPFTTVFGSMVADRLTDTLSAGALLLLTLLLARGELLKYLGLRPELWDSIGALAANPWVWAAIVLAAAGIWLLSGRLRSHSIVKRLAALWHQLWSGFAVVLKMPRRGRFLLLTLLLWALYFGGFCMAFRAFGFTTQILANHGLTAALVAFVFSSLSMCVPSNGGIGPWQWSIIFALSFYKEGLTLPAGVDFHTMASAFANLVMSVQTLLFIVLGIITFIIIALQGRCRRCGGSSESVPAAVQPSAND